MRTRRHQCRVEDTKTFLSILPLLLSLFGYHQQEMATQLRKLQRTSCPSLPVLLLIIYNPDISTLVSVVGIPLYRLMIAESGSKTDRMYSNAVPMLKDGYCT